MKKQKPAEKIACTTGAARDCWKQIPEHRAFVPSIETMQKLDGKDGRLASIAELKPVRHAVCPPCMKLIELHVPEMKGRFYPLIGSVKRIARILTDRKEREEKREAERKDALKATLGKFAGLNSKDGVKTEGRDGRKLAGAAANSIVRKAITKIAEGENERVRLLEAGKIAARLEDQARRDKIARRNAAMTAAAVGDGR